jgi:hypothetical protein
MGPSTDLHDAAGCHRAQLSQRCLPFGVFWYAVAFCDNLAAFAVIVVPSVAAAPTAPAALCNRHRREISPDQRIAMTLSPLIRLSEACDNYHMN